MSKIDEMLKNEKLEWKKLGEVAEISTGKSNTNEKVDDGKYPFYVRSKYIKRSDKFEFDETAIIIPGEGGIGDIFHYAQGKYALHQRAYRIHLIKEELNSKFIYYYIVENFKNFIQRHAVSATVSSIRKPMIENFLVPIPSLKAQEKIVNYLDEFTNYTENIKQELQKEFDLRNKQYEFYRDKLLSEEYLNKLINKYDLYKYKLKEKTLGEVIKLKNGRDWKTLNEGSIPVYGSGGPMNAGVNKFSYDKETVLIPRKGSIENVFYLNEPFWNVDTIYYTEVDTNLLNVKYFYYFMKNIDLLSLSINPTRPSLTQEIINNIKMTLPPIEIQEKIVEILDKFQALTQDVSGLLPDEIEKREKQYEYYREKLLAFDTECTRGGYQLLSNDYIGLLTQAGNLVGVKVFELLKKKLEDVCEILDSKRKPIKKSKRIIGIYPYYGANGIQDYVNDFIFDGSFVLMGEDGSVIDKNNNPILHWVNNKKIWVNNHAHILKNNDDHINLKYIYYSLSVCDVSSIVKGTPPKINQANLRNIKILIPPLSIQEYIVSILDKFEVLSQSTTEGLRREIELREKQYEYYREKLLTFEK